MNKLKPIKGFLLNVMRVTLAQIFIAVVLTSLASAANIKGQGVLDKKISLNVYNKEIKLILSEIEKQASVDFTYNPKIIKSNNRITLAVNDVTISEVLQRIFTNDIEYIEIDGGIVLKTKNVKFNIDDTKIKLANSIKGRITDENGLPLPGVNVAVKGTAIGTTTDADGNYSLQIPDDAKTLTFSFIGYTTKEVEIGTQTEINVALVTDIKTLSEVVVIGYGEAKKENYTGAVSTVGTKDLVQAPVSDISNALVGKLSGLIAVQRNGEPGQDGSQILIRGQSTFNNNDALIVVDGIPRGNFSQIDPNEIETLTILKDPAAAAVYGVRAANGVILVTTKRGKAGKSTISFSARTDWQRPARLPKYLDSYGYAKLLNEANVADGNAPTYTQAQLDKFQNGSDPINYPNTDWVKKLLPNYAPQQQYNVSLNGGTEKIRYFISLGHVNQKGLYANSGFKRYNFRSNIDANVTNSTRISLDVSGRSEDRNAPSDAANQLLYYALFAPPIYTAYYPNGLPGSFPTGRNPIEAAKSGGYQKNQDNTLLTTLTLNQQLNFIKGLSVKGVMAYDRTYHTDKAFRTPYKVYTYDTPTNTYLPFQGANINTIYLTQGFNQSSSLTLEAHLNYTRTFGKHNVGALILYTQNKYSFDNFYASRDNYIASSVDQLLAGDAATQKITGGINPDGSVGADIRTRKGIVGRLNYNFDNKYFVEGNFRYDGVSTFAHSKSKQYGFFPSVSAGWKISEEGFIRDNISAIDYLKLRASYGVLGNDRIDGYRYLATYGYGDGYVFGDGSDRKVYTGLYPSDAADANSTWETAKSFNIGLDGSIFKRLLSFEFDVFSKRTSGILIANTQPYPQSIGQGAPTQNAGIVDNKGFEFSLTHENSVTLGSKLTYFVKGNFTYAHNKIITIGENADVNPNTRQAGRPIGQFFGYQAIGLFNSQEEINNAPKQQNAVNPGDIRYADVSGKDANGKFTGTPDGIVDGNDQVAIGRSAIPQIIFGASAGVNFKGFDLSVLFQGATRVNAFVTGELAWPFYNGSKPLADETNHWTPDNHNAKYPRLTATPSGNNLEQSSYWLKDASYIRLKNLQLGYTIPSVLTSKISMGSARLFVSGQNLLTFDKIKVIDPEGPGSDGGNISGNSTRGWFYPQQKVYAIGINVTF